MLVKLMSLVCLLIVSVACGTDLQSDKSKVAGTPDEGDTVIGQLQNQFSTAQKLTQPRVLDLVIGRRMRCDAFDARSFSTDDHGSNTLQFDLTLFRSGNGLYQARYDWTANGSSYSEVVNAGIDSVGFGISGATRGSCAQIPIVHRVRRLPDNGVIIETVQLGACGEEGSINVTRSISHPGFSVLRYAICR